jgi:ribosomal protein L24
MSVLAFCKIKKGDRVIVLTGKFKRTIGFVESVVRNFRGKQGFLVSLDVLDKRKIKKKKGNECVEKDQLIDSSNVSIIV